MSDYYHNLATRVAERFSRAVEDCYVNNVGELTVVVAKENLLTVCQALRDESEFAFEQLIDVCGVDYSQYKDGTWEAQRFAVVYHLLSIVNNHRMRLKVYVDGDPPIVDSVLNIWHSANWYEREAFDLFGIVFDGHPDLRRILTDYGFIGHPFRKDFPLIGNVEMRYDPQKQRVIYQPVSIDPRVTQPKVIRDDHRYSERLVDREDSDA